jgi:hypothetical protein
VARQLVYEGPDLQQLLQQVIDEHGPARIHPPERRRKGGVLGFFAREVYVITVDVDAPSSSQTSSSQTPSAPVRASAGVDGSGVGTGAPAPHQAPATPAGRVTPGQTLDAVAGYGQGGGLLSGAPMQTPLSALVESTEDEAELGTANGGGPSSPAGPSRQAGLEDGATNGATAPRPPAAPATGAGRAPLHAAPPEMDKPFGEVLSEVASSLGEEPGAYRPDPERLRRPKRSPAGAETLFEPEPEPQPQPQPEGTSPALPSAPPIEAAARRARAPRPASVEAVTEPVPGEHDGPLEHDGHVDGDGPIDHGRRRLDDPTGEIAVQLPLIQIDEEGPPDLGATIVDLLRAAGFPEHLLPRAPLAPELSTIEAVFGALPEAPPLPAEPGGLVAVVGSAGLVRPVANAVAVAVGCARDEVAVASATASDRHARPENRARTAAQAASLSPGWRRDRVGVVAVYAPPLGADQRWTRQVLRALRPSCVWGMAGATTKPDDVRRWITAIGGVDALVLTEVGATATPAAILSLGVPVTRLDDEPATPGRWAAVVADLVTKH